MKVNTGLLVVFISPPVKETLVVTTSAEHIPLFSITVLASVCSQSLEPSASDLTAPSCHPSDLQSYFHNLLSTLTEIQGKGEDTFVLPMAIVVI